MRARDDQLAPPVLVVGVGNRNRGDDAIGPAIVDEINECAKGEFETLIAQGDLTDLVMRWSANTDVIVVDAMVSGMTPGTIVRVDGINEAIPTGKVTVSTHGIGLAETIELARRLDRLPRTLTLYAIEIAGTEHGEDLSSAVREAISDVVDEIVSTRLG